MGTGILVFTLGKFESTKHTCRYELSGEQIEHVSTKKRYGNRYQYLHSDWLNATRLFEYWTVGLAREHIKKHNDYF